MPPTTGASTQQFAVGYRDGVAAAAQRSRTRSATLSAVLFALFGILWLAQRPEPPYSGLGGWFEVLDLVIAAALLGRGLYEFLRLVALRRAPYLDREATPEEPLLVLDARGVLLDEGFGQYVRYPWEMVVFERPARLRPRDEHLVLHIGGMQRLLPAAALSCPPVELLRAAAFYRESSLTR